MIAPVCSIKANAPILGELIVLSPNLTNQSLLKSGGRARQELIAKASTYHALNTGQAFKNGKRVLLSSRQGGAKRAYSRHAHASGAALPNMAELSKYRLYEKSHKVLVGGFNTPSFANPKYKDGKKIGKDKRVKGIGGFKQIMLKNEFGTIERLSLKQKRFLMASGWGAAAKRGYVKKLAHPLINPYFSQSSQHLVGIFKDEFLNTLSRQAR